MSTYSMDAGQLCPAHSHLSLTAGVLFKCLHTQWMQDSYAQLTVTYHLPLECCSNVYILNGCRTVMPSSQSLITYCWSAV